MEASYGREVEGKTKKAKPKLQCSLEDRISEVHIENVRYFFVKSILSCNDTKASTVWSSLLRNDNHWVK